MLCICIYCFFKQEHPLLFYLGCLLQPTPKNQRPHDKEAQGWPGASQHGCFRRSTLRSLDKESLFWVTKNPENSNPTNSVGYVTLMDHEVTFWSVFLPDMAEGWRDVSIIFCCKMLDVETPPIAEGCPFFWVGKVGIIFLLASLNYPLLSRIGLHPHCHVAISSHPPKKQAHPPLSCTCPGASLLVLLEGVGKNQPY